MSNYYRLKNVGLFGATETIDIAELEKDFGNVFITGNIYIDNEKVFDLSSIAPRIHSMIYPDEARAAKTAGGETIILNGNGFKANAVVRIDNAVVSNVTIINSRQINFVSPSKTVGNYLLTVTNTDNGTATHIPGIDYSAVPSWTTAAGNRQTVYETQAIGTNLQFTQQDIPNFVEIVSGALPSGIVLNKDTGRLTGIAPIVTTSNVYSFTAGIRDYQNQLVTRNFSLTINPAPVTWNSPANNSIHTTEVGSAFNLNLNASNAISSPISYSATNMPSGLAVSGSTIAGTPTVSGDRAMVVTASAADVEKSATRNITIRVQPPLAVSAVGSPYQTGIKNVSVPDITEASDLWFIPAAVGAQVGDLVFCAHIGGFKDGGDPQGSGGWNPLVVAKARSNLGTTGIWMSYQWRILDSLDFLQLARTSPTTTWQSATFSIYRPNRPISNVWIHGDAQFNLYEAPGYDGLPSGAEVIHTLDSTGLNNFLKFHIASGHSEGTGFPNLQNSNPAFSYTQRHSSAFSGYWPTANWPKTSDPPAGDYGYVAGTSGQLPNSGGQVAMNIIPKGSPGYVQQVRSGRNNRAYRIEYMQYSAVFVIN